MFDKEGSKVLVIIKNNELYFGNTSFGRQLATIEGLQLSYAGVIKEFPDLKENPNWRLEAIKRLKEKVRSFKLEEEQADYVIEDLRKHYFVPLFKQKQGFRMEKVK